MSDVRLLLFSFRQPDLLLSDLFAVSRTVSQLYYPYCRHLSLFRTTVPRTWSWRWDSNPQPADYKSAALPIELRQPEEDRTVIDARSRDPSSTGDGEIPAYLYGNWGKVANLDRLFSSNKKTAAAEETLSEATLPPRGIRTR